MDERRFDALSRAFATTTSRRQTFRVLVNGMALGALALLGGKRTATAAKNCGFPGAPCCKTGVPCRHGFDCVAGICRIGSAEREICGFPGAVCCTSGVACRGGLECIRGVCGAGSAERKNCGLPGAACCPAPRQCVGPFDCIDGICQFSVL